MQFPQAWDAPARGRHQTYPGIFPTKVPTHPIQWFTHPRRAGSPTRGSRPTPRTHQAAPPRLRKRAIRCNAIIIPEPSLLRHVLTAPRGVITPWGFAFMAKPPAGNSQHTCPCPSRANLPHRGTPPLPLAERHKTISTTLNSRHSASTTTRDDILDSRRWPNMPFHPDATQDSTAATPNPQVHRTLPPV